MGDNPSLTTPVFIHLALFHKLMSTDQSTKLESEVLPTINYQF